MWSYYLYRAAGTIVPCFPPRLGYWLAERWGDLFSRFVPSRHAVEDNLRHVLRNDVPEARLKQVVRGVFRTQAKNYYDLFRLPALTDAQIKSLVTIHGLENLEAALSYGKGVVAVSAHFGNLEIVMQAFALNGYSVLAVAEHIKPEVLYRYLCSLRERRGARLIPADSFLKPIFRALARNEIVALAADRDITGSGIIVDFFGAPARLPDGYVQLALRTGAVVLPSFSLRQPGGKFVAYVERPVLMERTGELKRDVRLNLERVLPVIERYIAAYPEQWVMFQPIWKTFDAQVSAE